MRAGERRHRVQLQSPTVTLVSGENSTVWNTQATRWAKVEPLEGRELWRARQVQADVTHRITLVWESTFTPLTTWRVLFAGRVFQLLSIVRPEERRREWVLLAKEAV